MKEADFLARTGTLGPTLDRGFSDDERIVLKHFFTNVDKNIYAATDAMPNSLWALLEGGYSRSQLSMRMRFLNIFYEMAKEVEEGRLPREELVTTEDMAAQIRSGSGLDLSFFLSKAEKFMRKWAVQYGHDSLKDSDVVRFAVENVSQLAVCPIEEARLGAYQEKSSRYVPFAREFLIVPPDLADFEQEIRAWNDFLFSNYEESRPVVRRFISERLDSSAFKSPAAFDRTVDAKTLDVVRYFLPATMLTSLGIVWPTREAERHISRLLSDPREEVQSIGRVLLEEGKKVSPGLLKHVAVNDYQQSRLKNVCSLPISPSASEPCAGRSDDAVKLVYASPDMDSRIAASVLFEHGSCSYGHLLNICLGDPSLVERVLECYLGSRGSRDAFPISAEVGSLLYEVTVDFGAYRDLKRHRRNMFLAAPFTALNGFEYPQYVGTEPELADIKRRVELCAQRTAELNERVRAKHPHLACYVVMFANKQRILWQMDPRQLAYVAELRTSPAGHHSYRTICQRMFELAVPHMPVLSKYIRVDMSSGEEGRKKQEERTVEKLKELGGDVSRVS